MNAGLPPDRLAALAGRGASGVMNHANPCLLVAALPSGARVPAVPSCFPTHETDRQASTFPSMEAAKKFAGVLRALGVSVGLEILELGR